IAKSTAGGAAVLVLLLWAAGGLQAWAAIVALAAIAVGFAAAPLVEFSAQTSAAEPTPAPISEPSSRTADLSWRAVIGAMPDPAMVLDADGIIVHHNAAVADLFPRARIGHPISSVIRSPELLAA